MVISKILVVEDERIVAKDIKASLQSLGYVVPSLAASGEEAIKKAAELCPDIVLMDIHLDGAMDGVEAAEKIYTQFNIPIIYLTAHSDGPTLQRAKAVGPFGYIVKPFEEQDLFTTIETALHRYQIEKKLRESEQWWATTLRSVSDAVIATNDTGVVTFMNAVASALTGWKQSDAVGKNVTEVFNVTYESAQIKIETITPAPTFSMCNIGHKPTTQLSRSFEQITPKDLIVSSAQVATIEGSVVIGLPKQTILTAKNGANISIEQSAAPIKDDFGKIAGTVLVFRDITERQMQLAALEQANNQLKVWVNELEVRNREIALLSKMSDILQACLEVEEAYSAIAALMPSLFPQTTGGIFLISASKNLVEAVSSWGAPPLASQELFTPDQCWALRRGRLQQFDSALGGLRCQHLHPDSSPVQTLCVPMMAQGEALGMLHLSTPELGQLTPPKQQLASTVAEHIALCLANLKLREMLRNLSIRDPLTGLFNRRYLAESLEREIHRCQRQQQPLGLIMLEVDHFKRFNDTFGHPAVDNLLQELSHILQTHVRQSDIACRYRDETLALILPSASLDLVQQRAEQLRAAAKQLMVQYGHQDLNAITVSLGVASAPHHGMTPDAVLQAADAALWRAKASGGDTVMFAA